MATGRESGKAMRRNREVPVRESGDRPIGSFPAGAVGAGTAIGPSPFPCAPLGVQRISHAGVHGKAYTMNSPFRPSGVALAIAVTLTTPVLAQDDLEATIVTATRT